MTETLEAEQSKMKKSRELQNKITEESEKLKEEL